MQKARMHWYCCKYNELGFNASILAKIHSRRDSVTWILFSPSRFLWSGISVELSCRNRRIEKSNINTGIWSEWWGCRVPGVCGAAAEMSVSLGGCWWWVRDAPSRSSTKAAVSCVCLQQAGSSWNTHLLVGFGALLIFIACGHGRGSLPEKVQCGISRNSAEQQALSLYGWGYLRGTEVLPLEMLIKL